MTKLKILILILFSVKSISQVGIGTTLINNDAQLELFSSNQGLLVPRLDLIDTNNPSPLENHIQGMIVYNQTPNSSIPTRVVEGLYYNDGTKWILFVPNSIKIGDIKHSFSTADHNGWYLLDGRPINTLPAIAQNNAISLGQTINLINASDRFLKAKNNSDILGNCAGNKTFIINQTNLPNVNFPGTTSTDGSHTHLVDSYLGFQNIGLLSTSILTLFSIEQVAKDETISTNKTTELEGEHNHQVSVNSGGSNIPIERVPSFISTNVFIYLGQ